MKKIAMKTLETPRLILRKFVIEDAEMMYKNWGNDPKTSATLSWDLHETPTVTKTLVQSWIDKYNEDYSYNWVVELKDTNEIIGNIDIVKISPINNCCEIGYCYGSKFWGKGYASEALRIVLEFLLNEVEAHLVEAKHIKENPASGRVMEKAGMKKEAVLRSRIINKATGNLNDLIIYSITKEEL